MAFSMRQLKKMEAKIHDRLHDNIKLLTYIYPTNKEFDSVFKKNMFAKSNKAAFQHVVYYLFTTLDPELTKEKIKSWPLYDVKLENVFRTEVVAFITCLHTRYKNSNVPNLIASHLVTPGGLKFAKFMLKLSMLVLYEHLKKNKEAQPELLNSMTPCKNPSATKLMLKNVKAKSISAENQIREKCDEFFTMFTNTSKECQVIIAEQTQLDSDLATNRRILEEKKSKTDDSTTVKALVNQLKSLEPNLGQIEKIRILCEQSNNLLQYLSSDKLTLQFNKDKFFIPDNVKHLFKINPNELDLCHLFTSLATLLDNENLEMPIFTKDELNGFIQIVCELNEKCLHLDQRFNSHKNDLVEISESFYLGLDDTTKTNEKSKKTPIIVAEN